MYSTNKHIDSDPPISKKTTGVTYEENELMKSWLNEYLVHYAWVCVNSGEGSKEEELNKVIHLFNTLFKQGISYQFFIDGNIVDMTESIFSHEELRKFVLEGSNRLQFFGNTLGNSFLSRLMDTIVASYSNSVIVYENLDKSIAPVSISGVFQKDKEQIKQLLVNNPWIIFVYVFRLYFTSTSIIKSL